MSDTNDFAVKVHDQRRAREQAQIDALRKQETKLPDDARKALVVERIQKPEPIA